MAPEIIEILEKMGAKNVRFIQHEDTDDQLIFSYRGKVIVLSGVHYNDNTGGIAGSVYIDGSVDI